MLPCTWSAAAYFTDVPAEAVVPTGLTLPALASTTICGSVTR